MANESGFVHNVVVVMYGILLQESSREVWGELTNTVEKIKKFQQGDNGFCRTARCLKNQFKCWWKRGCSGFTVQEFNRQTGKLFKNLVSVLHQSCLAFSQQKKVGLFSTNGWAKQGQTQSLGIIDLENFQFILFFAMGIKQPSISGWKKSSWVRKATLHFFWVYV